MPSACGRVAFCPLQLCRMLWISHTLCCGAVQGMPHSCYASAAVPCIRRTSALPCPRTAGLAHVSELADDFVKDPAALFNPGQREFCGRPDCSLSNERMRGQPAPGSRLLWQQPYSSLHTPTSSHSTCCRLPLSPLLQAWWPACSRWMPLPTGCRWASSPRTLRTSGAARGCWGRARVVRVHVLQWGCVC